MGAGDAGQDSGAVEAVEEFGGGLGTAGGIGVEAVADGEVPVGGEVGLEGLGGGRGFEETFENFVDAGGALGGAAAGGHFEKRHAERVDIRARGGGLAAELLGGHVFEGAEELAGVGLGVIGRSCVGEGEAEIGDGDAGGVGILRIREDDVAGFEVTVGYGGGVGGRKAGCDLAEDGEDLCGRSGGVLFDPMRKGWTCEKLHGEEDGFLAVGETVAGDVEDAADVGVGDAAGEEGFFAEAAVGIGVGYAIDADCFEGDGVGEFGVLGFVDFAHAAGAEIAEDFVAGCDEVAGEEEGSGEIGKMAEAG